MRKKWEIEEEYRNFCRNNKELALQTLRELTLCFFRFFLKDISSQVISIFAIKLAQQLFFCILATTKVAIKVTFIMSVLLFEY